jgi:KDO2-lipid IV(A) lauroyltransferase
LLTGHCGNWELISAALSSRGVRVLAIARELQDPVLHAAVVGLRTRLGVETIVRGSPDAASQMRSALRGRALLAMLIDQDTDVRGAWVPFFGRPAWTPLGAAQLALRCRMSVVPAFDERRADGSHLVRFHPPLELPEDAVEATACMTRAIEDHIRRRPDQWVWTHRRWRRRPDVGTSRAAD